MNGGNKYGRINKYQGKAQFSGAGQTVCRDYEKI